MKQYSINIELNEKETQAIKIGLLHLKFDLMDHNPKDERITMIENLSKKISNAANEKINSNAAIYKNLIENILRV